MRRSFQAVPLLLTAMLFAETGRSQDYKLQVPQGLKRMRVPKDNPLSQDKIELGKQLYFDGRLSRDNRISCSSCHDPQKGWSNGARFATGIGGQVGGRSAPTIINAGYSYYQFWDGRALHVEGQALGPVQNPIEMDLTLDELVAKLNKIEGYRFREKHHVYLVNYAYTHNVGDKLTIGSLDQRSHHLSCYAACSICNSVSSQPNTPSSDQIHKRLGSVCVK